MHSKNTPPPMERGESPSTVNAEEENNELYDLEEANLIGDLDRLHDIYSTWFSKQRPEPSTGYVSKDRFRSTVYRAATNDQPVSLAYLLSQGIKFDLHILKAAVLSKSVRVLQVLLDHGWNINEAEACCEPPFLGLVVCDESLVRWFLAHGADPNATAGEWDVTPLSYAVAQAPLSIIKLLFEHGGSTANGQLLHYACDRTDSECVPILQYLVDRGAPTNDTLWENRPKLANWANVGATTPLHNAAAAGNIESVRFLLEHGADRMKRSVRFGKLPVDTAIACKHLEIAKILAEEPTLPTPRSGLWVALGWR